MLTTSHELDILKKEIIITLEKLAQYKITDPNYIEKSLCPVLQTLQIKSSDDLALLKKHLIGESNIPAGKNLPILVTKYMQKCANHHSSYIAQARYEAHKQACENFQTVFSKLTHLLEPKSGAHSKTASDPEFRTLATGAY